MSNKYSTRDLITRAQIIKQKSNMIADGGVRANKNSYDIWIDIYPIIDLSNIYHEGGISILQNTSTCYKIAMLAEHRPEINDQIIIDKQKFKIIKIIHLFCNDILLAIAKEEI